MKRYKIKIGKFGMYFHDTIDNHDMALKEVLKILNSGEEEGEEYCCVQNA